MNRYRQAYSHLMYLMALWSLERVHSSVIVCCRNVQSMGQLCKGLVRDQSCMEKMMVSEETDRKGRLFRSGGRQRWEVEPHDCDDSYCINSKRLFFCCQTFPAGAPNHFLNLSGFKSLFSSFPILRESAWCPSFM